MKKEKDTNKKSFWKSRKTIFVIATIFELAFGILLAVFADRLLTVVCYALGAALIVVGIAQLFIYFLRKNKNDFFNYSLVVGCALIIIGVVFEITPAFFMTILPIILGISLILGGVSKLQNSMDVARSGYKRFFIPLIISAVMIVCGVLTLIFFREVSTVTCRVIGIFLIANAIADFYNIFYVSSIYSKLRRKDREAGADSESNEIVVDNIETAGDPEQK